MFKPIPTLSPLERLYVSSNLEELLDRILEVQGIAAKRGEDDEINYWCLPHFSDDFPADTDGIYSWDNTRFLVCSDGVFEIINRTEWRN